MEPNGSGQDTKFYNAVLSLKTVEECRRFFREICSPQELSAISQRFEIASLLHSGRNYQEICGSTGASTATVCRVKKAVEVENGEIEKVLGKMKRKRHRKSEG